MLYLKNILRNALYLPLRLALPVRDCRLDVGGKRVSRELRMRTGCALEGGGIVTQPPRDVRVCVSTIEPWGQ